MFAKHSVNGKVIQFLSIYAQCYSRLCLRRVASLSCRRTPITATPNSAFPRSPIVMCTVRTYADRWSRAGGVDEEVSIRSIEEDDRKFDELTVDNFQVLIKSEEDRKLVVAVLEDYEYLKYTTYRVPTTINEQHMVELMSMFKTTQSSGKYFEYMFAVEMAKRKTSRAKERFREEKRARIESTPRVEVPPGVLFHDNKPIYKPWHNTILPWYTEQELRYQCAVNKMISAKFGQKVIFDFSYEDAMRKQDILNMTEQLSMCYGRNQEDKDPYDLYFCNYHENTRTHEYMLKSLRNLSSPGSLIETIEGSYIDRPDLFPKENLVYLSPHTKNSFNKFNHDDIFIIGALVDKTSMKPMSLAKAKREGIRVAKLPIDEYVVWGKASKVLTLNQIMGILLDVKNNGGNWREAFLKNIPQRKLKSPEEIAEEDARRMEKATFKRKNFFKAANYGDKRESGSRTPQKIKILKNP